MLSCPVLSRPAQFLLRAISAWGGGMGGGEGGVGGGLGGSPLVNGSSPICCS